MSTVTSMQSQKISSYLLGIAIIVLLPLAFLIEHRENNTWVNRLIFPDFVSEENRHTPIITDGTFLPPVVSENTHLTVNQNPIILSGTTTVPKHVSLVIEPDTTIYAHEYATLIVEGTLIIQGTDKKPVTFTTNEKHPSNKVWSGIMTQAGGHTTIDHARLSFASPAISCVAGSQVAVKNTRLEDGNTGIWQASSTCTTEETTFKRIHDEYVRTF